MVITDGSPPRVVRDQINSGSGTFVSGDSYRFEMVDAKTKELLAKMVEDAPDLGRMLRKSLALGYIAPDVAAAVATAAHSINEDVADALLTASRHINEGVAVTLHDASNHINETNATMFTHAADRLASLDVVGMRATADQVADTFASLTAVVEELNQATYAVHRAAAPFLRFTVSLRAAAMIFVVGVITGAVAYAHFAGR